MTYPQTELQSWAEADHSMKKLAECALALDTIEAEMNMKINDAKEEAKKIAAPLQMMMAEQERLLQDFTEGHR